VSEAPASGSTAPNGRPPRTVRLRTAVIVGVVSLLVGIGIGAAPKQAASSATATGSDVASASPTPGTTTSPQPSEPSSEPTAEPTAASTSEPTAEPTPAPLRPVVVKGSGSQKTKPFSMPDGDFTVVITGSGHSNVIIELIARGESSGELLFNEISNGKFKYSTVVYGVAAGSYYLDASVDGAWVVTFTPLP
jgi:septal ring-binding cell division protein DamX